MLTGKTNMKKRIGWVAIALCVLAVAQARALTDAEKCEAAKNKIAGKYAFCRQKAEAKAIKTGSTPDYSKCDSKYATKWLNADTSGGGMCPTSGDQTTMQSCITAHTAKVAAALNGGTCANGGLPASGQTTATSFTSRRALAVRT